MPIQNREGALWLATGIDNSGLYSGLNQAENRVDQFEAHIKRVGDNITRLTGIGFGIAGLKAFGSEIVNVRGEMQMLESSFEVLLGGKGVSGFMSEMKQFAVDSPLSMNGVANAAQTLLGFGIAAEKVMPTIKQIGDISMGNEDRFKSLSLAFAQMSATGKLMGQDLLQMINAGFNPLMTISEKTGKSIGDLKKEMESGSISSQMVADAFASATAEGGKFYGMTQKQAEGIRGLQAQLEGGLQDAFNEIGKSQEGLIAGGYKVATALVENYETVGKAIVALIATYGVYKAAVVFATQAEAGWNAVQLITYNRLLLVEKAQKLLNATMLSNPYVLAATLLVGLVTTMWALKDSTTAAERAQAAYNKTKDEAIEKEKEEKQHLSDLIHIMQDETVANADRRGAMEEIKKAYPDLFKKYIDEKGHIRDLISLWKEYNEQVAKDKVLHNKNNLDSAKVKYDSALKNYEDKKKQYGYSVNYSGIIEDARRRMEEAKSELSLYETDVRNDNINKVLDKISTYSEKQLQAALKNIENMKGAERIREALLAELNKKKNVKYYGIDYESAKKNWEEAKSELSKIEKDKDKFTTEQFNAAKEREKTAKDAFEKLGGQVKTNTKSESAAEKIRESTLKLLNTQAELDNEAVKQQLDHKQKLLDIEQDSFDKRYRQNQLNADKEFVAIKEYRQKMAKAQQEAAKDIYENNTGSSKGFNFATFDKSLLSDGLKDSDIDAQVKNMTDAIIAAYKKGNEDLAKEQEAFRDEERLTFASQLNQQIYSIRAHYKQRRIEAGNNAEDIKLINDNENKEIIAARLQAHQRQLEADADYNQKYQQLIEDRYVFESDKQKASLEQQIQDQEKIVELLKQRLSNDPNNEELANELRDANAELDKFKKFLAKIPEEKFAEIVGYVNQLVGSLSQLDEFEGFDKASSFFASAAQFATGDYIGGGVSALTGLISMFASEEDKRLQIQRELNKLQQQYNIDLRQQNVDLISSIDYVRVFRDNMEALNWLVQKGFISDVDYSAWDALNSQYERLKENINTSQKEVDSLMASASIFIKRFESSMIYSENRKSIFEEWNNSKKTVNDTIYALERLQATGVKGYESLIEGLKNGSAEVTDITNQLAELSNQMDEFATGTDFDSFLSDAANAIKDLRGDISGLADFTEEKLTNAILSSFKYQILSNALKPMYDELANMFLSGDYDASAANDWKQRLTDILKTNGEELDKIFEAFGIDPKQEDAKASSKGIASMSQDSANELNGNFFALLQKTGEIRNINEASRLLLGGINNGVTDIQAIMKENNKVFQDSLNVQIKIEQNTAETAEKIGKAIDILNRIEAVGLTIKN